jgi:predicted methyltransferase
VVRRVIAIDVSDRLLNIDQAPENFSFAFGRHEHSGASRKLRLGYSNQLMEHLHPDDASEQLANVYRALKPGGVYCCVRPNRISGLHDISVYFETVAQELI